MALWNLRHGAAAVQVPSLDAAGGWPTTTCVADATAHVVGVWTEVVSATNGPVVGLQILHFTASSITSGNSSALLDIGIGGSGAEIVVMDGFYVGSRGQGAIAHFIPLALPSGVRVTARIQAFTSSRSMAFKIIPVYGATGYPDGGMRCVAYGVDRANSRGAATAAFGTTTWGDWAEITSSTTAPTSRLLLALGTGGDTTLQATGTSDGVVQVGVGGSGVETAVLTLPFASTTAEAVVSNGEIVALTHAIPEGSRLSVRGSGMAVAQAFDASILTFF